MHKEHHFNYRNRVLYILPPLNHKTRWKWHSCWNVCRLSFFSFTRFLNGTQTVLNWTSHLTVIKRNRSAAWPLSVVWHSLACRHNDMWGELVWSGASETFCSEMEKGMVFGIPNTHARAAHGVLHYSVLNFTAVSRTLIQTLTSDWHAWLPALSWWSLTNSIFHFLKRQVAYSQTCGL